MSIRRWGTVAAVALMTALLSACGSDTEQNVAGPDYSDVTGAGRDLSFPSTVARTDYPDVCRLIPSSSMQTLIGAPVVGNRTITGCAWSTDRAALPTVAVKFVEIGRDAGQTYTQSRAGVSSASAPTDLGQRARLSRLNDNQTTRLDVMQANVFFRVEDRLTSTASHDLDNAAEVSIRVARLIANQISGSSTTSTSVTPLQTTSPPSLASTGSPTLELLAIGVLALVMGAAINGAGRRRPELAVVP